jgi:hypothetical protein
VEVEEAALADERPSPALVHALMTARKLLTYSVTSQMIASCDDAAIVVLQVCENAPLQRNIHLYTM